MKKDHVEPKQARAMLTMLVRFVNIPQIRLTSYATVNITCFEITANSEIHTNKPRKPAVYTSDKIKADLAEAKVITLSIRAKGKTLPVR